MSSYPPPYQPAQQNSTTAIISLISGILGLTVIPGIGSIIAVITGHMAKGEIRRSGGTLGGDGAATWGLVLGYIGIALLVITICGIGALFMGLCTLPFLIPVDTDTSSLLTVLSLLA
jgi:hypothetical protein